MSFRQLNVPSLGRTLSNVMACPSSAEPESHEPGLEAYRELGNCIHVHGEGGETHSRQAVGQWLKRHGRRSDFFLCCQICHEGWDPVAQRSVDRFAPEAVAADVAGDLSLIRTEYLDLVYVANAPGRPIEPVIEAIAGEIAAGRVRAFGARNWGPEHLRAAHACARRLGAPGLGAIVTTELALPVANCPLWPQDIPFAQLEPIVRELGLAVLAHADPFNLGEHLFADNHSPVHRRWQQRWDSPANRELARRVRALAAARGLTPVELNLAWLFQRSFPVVALVGLPDLLTHRRVHLERASQHLADEPFPSS